MDVHIDEIDSTIHATGSAGTLEEIVRAVIEKLREEDSHEDRAESESELRAGVSGLGDES